MRNNTKFVNVKDRMKSKLMFCGWPIITGKKILTITGKCKNR